LILKYLSTALRHSLSIHLTGVQLADLRVWYADGPARKCVLSALYSRNCVTADASVWLISDLFTQVQYTLRSKASSKEMDSTFATTTQAAYVSTAGSAHFFPLKSPYLVFVSFNYANKMQMK
jgi:hypothetical protein